MFDLSGKTALVTGASGGIGAEIARVLHAAGATVAVSGTRLEPLEALAVELGSRVHVLACNLSDPAEVEALPKRATEAMGSVDILVNNAGITRDNLFMRMSDDEWDSVIAVNLTAAMRLCRGVVRGMMKKRWGRIVSITSVVGVTGNPGQGNYAAAKAGLGGFVKSVAREVASRGITANVVAPGFIDTEMSQALPEAARNALLAQVPLGRPGSGEDVAQTVAFLASEEAGYLTGQVLAVDGGMTM